MSRPLDEGGAPPDMLAPLDEGPGPARRLSRQKSAALVQAALLAAMEAAPPPAPRHRRWQHVWLMGGALLVVGAGAVAAWHLSRRDGVMEAPRTMQPSGSDASARAERDPAMGTEPGAGTPPARDISAGANLEAPVPAAAAPTREVVAGQDVAPSTEAPSVWLGTEKARTAQSAPAPEDLLRRANDHRATGQWKAAEALYQRVIRAQPQGMAAYVARVASGSLRLEHLGDARGALRQYEEALRGWPGGVLEEEAGHGVVEALRALGDTPGEARALESFLTRHPDSPHGVAARARLREISNR